MPEEISFTKWVRHIDKLNNVGYFRLEIYEEPTRVMQVDRYGTVEVIPVAEFEDAD